MALQDNIKYVREKKIAGLLNEMVLHVLSKTPDDPLEELIAYLEDRIGAAPARPAPATTSPRDKYTAYSTPGDAPPPVPPISDWKQQGEQGEQKQEEGRDVPADVQRRQDEANSARDCGTPRSVMSRQQVHRSSAVELVGDDEADEGKELPDTTPVIAELVANESLARNMLEEGLEEAQAAGATDASMLLRRSLMLNDMAMQALTKAEQNSRATLMIAEQRQSKMDPVAFRCKKTLDLLTQLIKNEKNFSAGMRTNLLEVERREKREGPFEWVPEAKDVLRQALNNSEAILGVASTNPNSMEKNTIKIETALNAGTAGKGSVHFIQDLSGAILKQIYKVQKKGKEVLEDMGVHRDDGGVHSHRHPMDNLLQQFLFNEHVFRKHLKSWKDEAKNTEVITAVEKATANSRDSEDVMKQMALNYIYVEDGNTPKNTQDLLGRVQVQREAIRSKTKELKEVTNRLYTDVYASCTTGAAKALQREQDPITEWVTKQNAENPGVPELVQAQDLSERINAMTKKLAENSEMIREMTARKCRLGGL